MQESFPPPGSPEYNVTGIDYNQRDHLRYRGPLIDLHAHVMLTRPGDPRDGQPGANAGPSIAQ